MFFVGFLTQRKPTLISKRKTFWQEDNQPDTIYHLLISLLIMVVNLEERTIMILFLLSVDHSQFHA